MFLLTPSMFLWSSHCLEDFLRNILRGSCFPYGSARPTLPLHLESKLSLQAKQNALFEFLSSFRSHDL